jgi:uncharacterized protein
MRLFLLIIVGLPLLNVLWWIWAHRHVRPLARARTWQALIALLALGHLAGYGCVLLARIHRLPELPVALLTEIYLWHLAVLPAATLLIIARGVLLTPVDLARRLLARRTTAGAAEVPEGSAPQERPIRNQAPPERHLSRREMIAAGLALAPPVLAAAAHVQAWREAGSFRVRRMTIALPTLPETLDGLKIAHVSDTHVGRFMNGPLLDEIAAAVNAADVDLVAFTGDLIDHALADLPAGLRMLDQCRARYGLYACEGNHDLFEGRAEFEDRVRAAGVRLLLNESAEVFINGTCLQLLGIQWGQPGAGRSALLEAPLAATLRLRRPDAFPVLLAHHPHAFDAAADAGIPLTLSGHTHGGQLMLTRDFGAGTVLFKYWSGLYRRGDAALVVSNGAGNWLPLRINAPAEIGILTLRRELREM